MKVELMIILLPAACIGLVIYKVTYRSRMSQVRVVRFSSGSCIGYVTPQVRLHRPLQYQGYLLTALSSRKHHGEV